MSDKQLQDDAAYSLQDTYELTEVIATQHKKIEEMEEDNTVLLETAARRMRQIKYLRAQADKNTDWLKHERGDAYGKGLVVGFAAGIGFFVVFSIILKFLTSL